MKLFAKRKRKTEDAASGKSKADQVVEDILKANPSTWNSKQRRLVKRYRERHGATDDDTPRAEQEPSPAENEASSRANEESSPALDAGSVEQEHDAEQSQPQPQPIADFKDDGLNELLDKLNSKMRRKLSRQLERGGDRAQIRAEAEALLGDKNDCISTENRAGVSVVPSESSEGSTKKKRRKGATNLSDLPPEERMRREEQRRLQKEAAERRSKGETSGYRHPLNSERRRANRRKPKYAPKVQEQPNEHDTSGFVMRKRQKTETAVAH